MSQAPPPAPSLPADPGSTPTPPPARPAQTLSAAQAPAAGSPSTPDRPAATAPAAPAAGFRVTTGRPTPSRPGAAGSPRDSLADPLNSATIGLTGTPSSANQQPITVDKKAVREIGRGLVLLLTDLVHDQLARSREAQEAELWRSTEAEQKGIGDPLANIAVRHGGGLPGSPDVADLVKAGLSALGYAARNTREHIKIRKAKRQREKLAVTPDLPEHPPSERPAA